MADEKVKGGSDEVSSAEPEVMEQAAVDTPPEAAAPEPEVAEPAEPAAGEPAMAEPEPETPGGDMSPQVDGQEQPDAAESVAEDAPAQASLFGEEAPAAEQPEPPAPGEDGEVVVSFEQISELISKRNQEARAAIEQEEAAVPQPGDVDKGSDEPSQQEPAPKRRGRPPKEKQPEHEEKTDKPRRGRKPKEAVPDRDTPAGKPRDKVSRGKRGKAAPAQDAPGGGAAAGAPIVGENVPAPDIGQPSATTTMDAAVPPRPVEDQKVVYLKLSELHPFHTFRPHPFQVMDDAKMKETVASVKQMGVITPATVRPEKDGNGYEIIAGHRRCRASELAGLEVLPCIVREMTDHEAIREMRDSNKQRDGMLPTEFARLLDLEMEDIKHQGVPLKNVAEGDIGKRSAEIVGEAHGMNYKKVMRYIRLNSLVPELQAMVDGHEDENGKRVKGLGFMPAVELSYIRPKNQQLIAVSIEGEQASPSVAQAKKLRELDQQNKLTGDVIDAILSEEKKEVGQVIISADELSKYFGKEVTPRQMKDQIMALLDEWKEKQPPEKKAELEK